MRTVCGAVVAFTRPLHRLRRSPSPASQGRNQVATGGREVPPPSTGEGDRPKGGGGGVGLAKGGAGP